MKITIVMDNATAIDYLKERIRVIDSLISSRRHECSKLEADVVNQSWWGRLKNKKQYALEDIRLDIQVLEDMHEKRLSRLNMLYRFPTSTLTIGN